MHDRGDFARRGRPGLHHRGAGLRSFLARRPEVAPALLAIATVLVAAGIALAAGLSFRDPGGIFGRRALLLLGTAALVLVIDIVPRALLAGRGSTPWGRIRRMAEARRVRSRAGLALAGIVSFYLTYVAYRNLKSYLPVFVDQDLDQPLRQLERSIFFGNDPATLLHELLGTGAAAHVLSFFYLAFITFVPVSVALSLTWPGLTRAGLWYTTALGFNWVLGLLGYYLVPALGPVFVYEGVFDGLPQTGVFGLQAAGRVGPGEFESIAAFPSLHVSVVFTAALIASRLRLNAILRWSLWSFLVLTLLATVYFGWHYVVDDVAGLALGALAVQAAAPLTGHPVRRRDRSLARRGGWRSPQDDRGDRGGAPAGERAPAAGG